MQYNITLDHDTSAFYSQLSRQTGMPIGDLVNRQLNSHHMEVLEMVALASAHPELSNDIAELFRFNDLEPLLVGVRRIAPAGYLTLIERFEQEMSKRAAAEKTP